jgi:hypothetical protein
VCELRFRRIFRLAVAIRLMLLSLGACQNTEQQLYVAHDTKLGIDASYNAAMTAGSIDLGYDRRFVTWVPQSVEIYGGDNSAKEAMSVIACSMLQVGALSILYYDESMATGQAAKMFAQQLRAAQGIVATDYFKCFSRREGEQETPQ